MHKDSLGKKVFCLFTWLGLPSFKFKRAVHFSNGNKKLARNGNILPLAASCNFRLLRFSSTRYDFKLKCIFKLIIFLKCLSTKQDIVRRVFEEI